MHKKHVRGTVSKSPGQFKHVIKVLLAGDRNRRRWSNVSTAKNQRVNDPRYFIVYHFLIFDSCCSLLQKSPFTTGIKSFSIMNVLRHMLSKASLLTTQLLLLQIVLKKKTRSESLNGFVLLGCSLLLEDALHGVREYYNSFTLCATESHNSVQS